MGGQYGQGSQMSIWSLITIGCVLTKPLGIFENLITTRTKKYKNKNDVVAIGVPFRVQNDIFEFKTDKIGLLIFWK